MSNLHVHVHVVKSYLGSLCIFKLQGTLSFQLSQICFSDFKHFSFISINSFSLFSFMTQTNCQKLLIFLVYILTNLIEKNKFEARYMIILFAKILLTFF